jgi:hypothetical protein
MTGRFFPLSMAILLAGPQASAAAADPVDQLTSEMTAFIEIEAGHRERGQTVQSLVECLRDWNPGDGRRLNDVVIRRTGDGTFTVQANLRSSSYFIFQALRERGELVAVLVRVEYLRGSRGYQQVTDSVTKRAVMQSVCPG